MISFLSSFNCGDYYEEKIEKSLKINNLGFGVMKRRALMKLKSEFVKFSKWMFSKVGKATKYLESKPIVVVWVDGGFASQVFRLAMGRRLKELGFQVKYDLHWFQNYGKTKIKDHDFSCYLQNCFELSDSEVVKGWQRVKYRLLYNTRYNGLADKAKNNIMALKAPFCINFYEFDWIMNGLTLNPYIEWKKIENILSKKSMELVKEIRESHVETVGVHVRRGDMGQYVEGSYWKVLTPEYFIKAFECLPKKNLKVYFFSNGIDYVKEELLGLLENAWDVTIVSELDLVVYEELYLLSLCDTVIASQGSWGDMAFDFHEGDGLLIKYSENIEADKIAYQKKYPGKHEIFIPLTKDMYLHG